MSSKHPWLSAAPKKLRPVFWPKILSCIRGYNTAIFTKDLTAGVIVGIVALPLAIAFAIASGVTPDRGLVTAIVAGFLISAVGGSRVQIGGPTGAFVVIVYEIVQKYGVDGLIVCTLIAGFILVAFGLLRLGVIIKFIPYPLTVGFTSGIAVIIFSSQVKDFFGLSIADLPADFVDKWILYAHNFDTLDWPTVLLSVLSMAILFLWPKISRKIPGSFVAIVVITIFVAILHIDVATIGSRFGKLPTTFPSPHWPSFHFHDLKGIVGPAFTIAILGAIESLLSATVADGMMEGRHRPNTELIAQGVANIFSSLFGGIPATGAIARTATNVKNGAQTPVAGIIHALVLLVIVLAFGRWAKMIPLCVLASILMVIAYRMSEWRTFRSLLRAPRTDVAVLLTTFLLTVFVDLTVAVEIGLLMALVLFMKRMTDVTTVRQINAELNESVNEEDLRKQDDATTRMTVPKDVAVYEAEGALFFGVASLLQERLDLSNKPPRALILRMRHVLVIDATGIEGLRNLKKQCSKFKTRLILSGVHAQPLIAMEQSGFLYELGEDNVAGSVQEALMKVTEPKAPTPSPQLSLDLLPPQ